MDTILAMLMRGAGYLGPLSYQKWTKFMSGWALEIINLDPKVKELWPTIAMVMDAASGSTLTSSIEIRSLLSDCLYNGAEPDMVFASLVWLHQAGLIDISVGEGVVFAHCWDISPDVGSILYVSGTVGHVQSAIWDADVTALRSRVNDRLPSAIVPNGARPWKSHPVATLVVGRRKGSRLCL